MEDEEKGPKKPVSHDVGMNLDGLSVFELEQRISLLEGEIGRLKEAIDARGSTKRAAEAAFKF
jgi:uncharacterized small protein (DUF1192 family)